MIRKTVVATLVVAMSLAFAIAGAAADPVELAPDTDQKQVVESDTGSYIVVMEQDPVVVEVGQDGLDSPEAEALAEEREDEQEEVLEAIGRDESEKVHTYTGSLNGFSAFLSYEEAQAAAADPRVSLVLPDELHQLTTDSSPQYLGLTKSGEAWASGLTGEDVIVGVIDSGIWPEHPSFADDGSYADLGIELDESERSSCDFGNAGHVTDASIGPDEAFACNNKLLGARQMIDTYRALIGATPFEYDSARDDDGHGTHTAATAAGNANVPAEMYGHDLGEVSGIAPRARVIAYKGLGALGGFTSDLASSIDQAVFDGVDVINYSVGGGASLPTGADDIAFLFAADAGVFVATSAGNSGPGGETVGSPGTSPWMTTVGASTQDRFYEGTVKVKGGPDVKGASLTGTAGPALLVDAADAGNDLCLPGTLDPEVVEGNIVLCRRGAIARAGKSAAVAAAGGIGTVLYNNEDADNLFTDTHVIPAVHINNSDGLKLKEHLAKEASKKNPKPVMAEITKTGGTSRAKGAPSMAYFSSRGPNGPVPDIIKPDITAPGHQILAAAATGVNPVGDSFQAISGTSMSSPHVAGLFALLKQAHPDWSPAAARSAIMTTADTKVKSEDRKTQATPFEMGAGEINPGKLTKEGSAFNPGLVYDAGLFEYAAFTCGADLGIFTPGSCSFLDGLGIPSDASDLNLASIGVAELAGSQTVVRTVTSVADETVTYMANVDDPDGYDVTVSPERFTIAPGESVTLEITIVNGGAPSGEWRTGALELEGKGYVVRSPIAVKGALFDAPSEVEGSGTTGSVDVPVLFGYDGAYSAGAHGLVPSTVLSGSIGQDPDQTFGTGDDAPGPGGGVDLYPLAISDSAFLRVALTIPGDDDIDLFLLDSGGSIVASSTSGGTDELIEVVLPPDDTYTLAVHGWSVPSGPVPYAVDTWSVPLAAGGGSLAIGSAPTSAATGTSGIVTASWTGLTTGESYLGAISHSDDGGLLGLTLVSVDG